MLRSSAFSNNFVLFWGIEKNTMTTYFIWHAKHFIAWFMWDANTTFGGINNQKIPEDFVLTITTNKMNNERDHFLCVLPLSLSELAIYLSIALLHLPPNHAHTFSSLLLNSIKAFKINHFLETGREKGWEGKKWKPECQLFQSIKSFMIISDSVPSLNSWFLVSIHKT